MTKQSKQMGRKALPAMGTDPVRSAMVGGVSNTTANPSEKKSGATMKFAKGGPVRGVPHFDKSSTSKW